LQEYVKKACEATKQEPAVVLAGGVGISTILMFFIFGAGLLV
jgi:hypothetical protein